MPPLVGFHGCLTMHRPTTVVEICPESLKTGRLQMVFRNHLDFDPFVSQFEVLHSLPPGVLAGRDESAQVFRTVGGATSCTGKGRQD